MAESTGPNKVPWSLPTELNLRILELTGDARTLASAALTCQQLYAAFRLKPNYLIRLALAKSVGHDTLPEATIVHRCEPPFLSTTVARLPEYDREDCMRISRFTREFLERLERPILASTTWSLGEALKIEEFHKHTVLELVDRLIQLCPETTQIDGTNRMPVKLAKNLSLNPPTRTERERMSRAFYRFELFRKLYGCFGWEGIDYLGDYAAFFVKFSSWESAQLGCVHDFLANQVIPGQYLVNTFKDDRYLTPFVVFNRTAELELDWGPNIAVSPNAELKNPEIQHFLTLGLEWIRKLVNLATYPEAGRALIVEGCPPEENRSFLYYAFEYLFMEDYFAFPEEDKTSSRPFCTDDDGEPKQSSGYMSLSWTTVVPDDSVYEEDAESFRQWGYALWDLERLKALDRGHQQ